MRRGVLTTVYVIVYVSTILTLCAGDQEGDFVRERRAVGEAPPPSSMEAANAGRDDEEKKEVTGQAGGGADGGVASAPPGASEKGSKRTRGSRASRKSRGTRVSRASRGSRRPRTKRTGPSTGRIEMTSHTAETMSYAETTSHTETVRHAETLRQPETTSPTETTSHTETARHAETTRQPETTSHTETARHAETASHVPVTEAAPPPAHPSPPPGTRTVFNSDFVFTRPTGTLSSANVPPSPTATRFARSTRAAARSAQSSFSSGPFTFPTIQPPTRRTARTRAVGWSVLPTFPSFGNTGAQGVPVRKYAKDQQPMWGGGVRGFRGARRRVRRGVREGGVQRVTTGAPSVQPTAGSFAYPTFGTIHPEDSYTHPPPPGQAARTPGKPLGIKTFMTFPWARIDAADLPEVDLPLGQTVEPDYDYGRVKLKKYRTIVTSRPMPRSSESDYSDLKYALDMIGQEPFDETQKPRRKAGTVASYLENIEPLHKQNLMFRDERGFVRFPYRMDNSLLTPNETYWANDRAFQRDFLRNLPPSRFDEVRQLLNLTGDPSRPLRPDEARRRGLTMRPGFRLRQGNSIIRRHQLWHWFKLGTIMRNLHDYFFEPIPGYRFGPTPAMFTLTPTPRQTTEFRFIWTPRFRRKKNKKRVRYYRPIDWKMIPPPGGTYEDRTQAPHRHRRPYVTFKNIFSLYGSRRMTLRTKAPVPHAQKSPDSGSDRSETYELSSDAKRKSDESETYELSSDSDKETTGGTTPHPPRSKERDDRKVRTTRKPTVKRPSRKKTKRPTKKKTLRPKKGKKKRIAKSKRKQKKN